MQLHRRSALLIFATSLALNCTVTTDSHAQSLQDFGNVGQSPIWNQIRQITDQAEATRIYNTRVCNLTVPLAGSVKQAADATEEDWRSTLASYELWEADYRRRQALGLPLTRPSDEEGKEKYIKQRQAGTTQRTMQLFAYAFYLRAMYRNKRYVDTVSTADRIIENFRLSPAFHQVDTGESKGTYLADETLANAIYLFSRLGRIRSAETNAARFLAIVRYLDIRDELLSTINLKFFISSRDDDAILSDAARLAGAAISGALGPLPRAAVKASWVDNDGAASRGFVVFRGKRSNTVQISFGGAGTPPPPANDNDADATPDGPGRPLPFGSSGAAPASGGLGSYADATVMGATVIAATAASAAYRRFVDSRLVAYSGSAMALFDVQKEGENYRISFAKPGADKASDLGTSVQRFTLQSADIKALMTGAALPASHPVPFIDQLKNAAIVEYSNPFMAADNDNEFRVSTDSFTFGLQRTFPDRQIYRDSLSERTESIVRCLSAHAVGHAGEYVAIVADDSFKVTDYRIVQNVRRSLTEAGISIQKGLKGNNEGKNVILVTAHSDEEFARFVDALGGADSFRGSYVIINSCETSVTRRIAEKITGQFGAKAAFVYEGTIPVEKVSSVIETMAKTIKEKSKDMLVDYLRRLTKEQGLTGIWSVS